uniref:tRNA pseudouridine synthase n=1 Tax=Peronospora matthiolae TaxID=2874970 RepID=A0AAV1VNE7_9STRA
MSEGRKYKMPPSAFLHVDAAGPWIRRRCVVEYDGTDFCGSQAQDQPSLIRTVQEVIEDALSRTTGETALTRLRFASRTDTGVHARGQEVLVVSRCSASDRIFRDALNNRLPDDVQCRSMTTLTEAQASFDPCLDAAYKRYEYEVLSGGLRPVARRRNVWHVRKSLDVAKMRTAVKHLMAPPLTKDFSSFTPHKSVDEGHGNVCTVFNIQLHVEKEDGSDDVQYEGDVATRIRLVFDGDRFRYKMVRNLVGTIVDAGSGRLSPDGIPMILAAKHRGTAGQGAPPQGLTLVWVKYD